MVSWVSLSHRKDCLLLIILSFIIWFIILHSNDLIGFNDGHQMSDYKTPKNAKNK